MTQVNIEIQRVYSLCFNQDKFADVFSRFRNWCLIFGAQRQLDGKIMICGLSNQNEQALAGS